jgi:ATPase subunit of ABC transporter with duplicated ATPase domains
MTRLGTGGQNTTGVILASPTRRRRSPGIPTLLAPPPRGPSDPPGRSATASGSGTPPVPTGVHRLGADWRKREPRAPALATLRAAPGDLDVTTQMATTLGTLTANGLSRYRGTTVILEHVDLTVGPGDRIGIVGPNGVGKSTLLRILAGLERADSGRVTCAPPALTVGYLPQETAADAPLGETLRASLARRTGVAQAEAAFEAAAQAMAASPHDIATATAYSDALERYLALGGPDLDARTGSVCAQVGLPADRLDVAVASLSGGQQARAALAAILLANFDVFLLDEPTNDLDFTGLRRLEEFAMSSPGGMVVISHDRAFLDRAVSEVVEIDEHLHTATRFGGGWAAYLEARAVARRHAEEGHERFVADRSQLLARAHTQRQWAITGAAKAKKRPPDNDKAQRDFRINKTEKQAAKLRITEKRIERLEPVDKPWEGWQLQLVFKASRRSGDVVARLSAAVVEQGSFRLGPVSLEIGWAERVAIVGPNGAGKTTLLRALLGEIPLTAGERWLGPGVVVGQLDQGRRHFLGDGTLLSSFTRATGLLPEEARSLLAKFGLGPRHVGRRPASLSPGERTRAVLALLMATGVNCLVLDEPTNHLDLPAIEQLEEALEGYDGTLLLVTHDRALLEAVNLTRTVDLGV